MHLLQMHHLIWSWPAKLVQASNWDALIAIESGGFTREASLAQGLIGARGAESAGLNVKTSRTL